MERFTEYHCGVAVIKDKSKLKEAMEKLAGYEDAEELSKEIGMEKITTEFAEWICDECCGKLNGVLTRDTLRQEEADAICDECKIGKFICDICNKYLELDRFVGSNTEKLLKENSRLKEYILHEKGGKR